MAVRLLIKRPQPAHAAEFSVGFGQDVVSAAANARVVKAGKELNYSFGDAMAHVKWISSAGAVAIVAVNDNA